MNKFITDIKNVCTFNFNEKQKGLRINMEAFNK